jgi:autotransporter adhesin
VGAWSRAAGAFGVALGGGTNNAGDPDGAQADGYRSIAVGQKSASADFGTSVGFNTSTAFASTALGTDATASGDSSTTVGRFSAARAASSTALGFNSKATGTSSAAVGDSSRASGVSSLALGRRAIASKGQSVAIGNGSIADVANTVSVGRKGAERRIVNVAAGVKPTDAVNLAQVKALIAAATGASSATAGMRLALEPPAVPVVAVGLDNTRHANDDIRRELAELRALVKRQQAMHERQEHRIAQLESHAVAAAAVRQSR